MGFWSRKTWAVYHMLLRQRKKTVFCHVWSVNRCVCVNVCVCVCVGVCLCVCVGVVCGCVCVCVCCVEHALSADLVCRTRGHSHQHAGLSLFKGRLHSLGSRMYPMFTSLRQTHTHTHTHTHSTEVGKEHGCLLYCLWSLDYCTIILIMMDNKIPYERGYSFICLCELTAGK